MTQGGPEFTALKTLVDQLLVPLPSKCTCAKQANALRAQASELIARSVVAQPAETYTDAMRTVLWWDFSADAAPFVGTRDEADAAGSFPFFSTIIVPVSPD